MSDATTEIVKDGVYRLDPATPEYFENKYAQPKPRFRLEGEDVEVFGNSWMDMTGNPGCLLYAMRSAGELPLTGKVYYGKIAGLGELVHESELGELVSTDPTP